MISRLKKTSKFNYLRSTLNDKPDSDGEVKIRTAMARTALGRFDTVYGKRCP